MNSNKHYFEVSGRSVKPCRKCGADVTLVQSKAGKWYAVDVIPADHVHVNASKGYCYAKVQGRYGWWAPWHECAARAEYDTAAALTIKARKDALNESLDVLTGAIRDGYWTANGMELTPDIAFGLGQTLYRVAMNQKFDWKPRSLAPSDDCAVFDRN